MTDQLTHLRETFGFAGAIKPAEKKYDPSQPRHPEGDPRGGQWSSDGGGGAEETDSAAGTPKKEYPASWYTGKGYEANRTRADLVASGGWYYVKYHNQASNRTEKTPRIATLEEAESSAEFLSSQGAKWIKIDLWYSSRR